MVKDPSQERGAFPPEFTSSYWWNALSRKERVAHWREKAQEDHEQGGGAAAPAPLREDDLSSSEGETRPPDSGDDIGIWPVGESGVSDTDPDVLEISTSP